MLPVRMQNSAAQHDADGGGRGHHRRDDRSKDDKDGFVIIPIASTNVTQWPSGMFLRRGQSAVRVTTYEPVDV